MTARALTELAAGLTAVPGDIVVHDVTLDSRTVGPGTLFLACKGRTHHGLKFAEQAVSQGARAVLYEESPDVGTAEIIVAKQRNGPTGKALLRWDGAYTRFENLQPGEVPEGVLDE